VKTTVVCGLLGSGKTTFISNRIKNATEKTVVLVNDFGASGIDGEIFSSEGIETIELPSGCVCCTLKFDLITTLQKVIKYHAPEHLMIEPSGVASPSGVIEALASAGIERAVVVGIVDVTEFMELHESGMYGSFFEEQIVLSDVVLLNKTDLVGADMADAVMARIESLNPRAILFKTEHAEIHEDLAIQGGKTGARRSARSHFDFMTETMRVRRDIDLGVFESWLRSLAAGTYGNVVRAKALVHTSSGPYRFDIVYGRVDRHSFAQEIKDGRIVVIGTDLDRVALERGVPG